MLVRFGLAAAALVFLTCVATASALLLNLGSTIDRIGHINAPSLQGVPDGQPTTILVLGSDRRFADSAKTPARSDTMMLIRLDPDRGTTTMLSLPRDLKTAIPGHGTDKLNAAYAYGGEDLTVKTIDRLLRPHSPTGQSFAINHVVNINFGGFERAVNHLNCIYVDIDKQYFNDNNPPAGGGSDYAAIDIPAGYQRLCGQDALDYVRYRHFDSDLVRGARQQEFLKQAKAQVGVGQLINDHKALLDIVADYMQTDIKGTKQVLGLLRTVVSSSKHPLQQIQFPAGSEGDYVTADGAGLDSALRSFLKPKLNKASATKKRKQRSAGLNPPAVTDAKPEGEDQAVALQTSTPLPVLFPKVKTPASEYMTDQSRSYILEDRQNHKYPSYRIVVRTPLIGQYYGIQGTKWQNPPILDGEYETRKLGGREFRIYNDGSQIQLIALKTKDGSYWVSNTLSQSLSNAQMLAIARTLGPIGGK